jgi:hypothetical protein
MTTTRAHQKQYEWVNGDEPSEERNGYRPWVRCSYCGSLDPAFLGDLLRQDMLALRFAMADMKYGWPHKYYVHDLPHPAAHVGKPQCYGQEWRGGVLLNRLISPIAETGTWKFYTSHLRDATDADRELIEKAMRTRFDFGGPAGNMTVRWWPVEAKP